MVRCSSLTTIWPASLTFNVLTQTAHSSAGASRYYGEQFNYDLMFTAPARLPEAPPSLGRITSFQNSTFSPEIGPIPSYPSFIPYPPERDANAAVLNVPGPSTQSSHGARDPFGASVGVNANGLNPPPKKKAKTKGNNAMIICTHDGCVKDFATEALMKRHRKKCINPNLGHPCPFCGRTYSRKDAVSRHQKNRKRPCTAEHPKPRPEIQQDN